MARLSFRCDVDLVEAVDLARGEIPRERWLRDVVQREASPVTSKELAGVVVEESLDVYQQFRCARRDALHTYQELLAALRRIDEALAEALRTGKQNGGE
jgi:hypothetical protein